MTKPLYVLDKPLEWFGDDDSPAHSALGRPALETALVEMLRAHRQAKDTDSNGKSNTRSSGVKRVVKEERSKRLKPIRKRREQRERL